MTKRESIASRFRDVIEKTDEYGERDSHSSRLENALAASATIWFIILVVPVALVLLITGPLWGPFYLFHTRRRTEETP